MKSLMSVVALVVVFAADQAWACSCGLEFDTFPRNGATNVPTNVVIRAVNGSPNDPFRLLRVADQQEIEITVRKGPGRLASITPTTKLNADTKYQLISVTSSEFTTGAVEDHDVPAKPELRNASYEYFPAEDSCGDRRLWTLQLAGGDDATTEREQMIILVHGQTSSSPADAIGVTSFSNPTLDTGLCSTNFSPPEGDSFALGVQVMDLAGNVSEISAGRPIRATSCSAAPGGMFALLGLALFSRRRAR